MEASRDPQKIVSELWGGRVLTNDLRNSHILIMTASEESVFDNGNPSKMIFAQIPTVVAVKKKVSETPLQQKLLKKKKRVCIKLK